jgi:hypothetical protein
MGGVVVVPEGEGVAAVQPAEIGAATVFGVSDLHHGSDLLCDRIPSGLSMTQR